MTLHLFAQQKEPRKKGEIERMQKKDNSERGGMVLEGYGGNRMKKHFALKKPVPDFAIAPEKQQK